MSSPLETIKLLIEKALHEATPEEESRTCAIMALKMLRKHDVQFHIPGSVRANTVEVDDMGYPVGVPEPPWAPTAAPPPPPPVRKNPYKQHVPEVKNEFYRSISINRCEKCGLLTFIGDVVWGDKGGKVVYHKDCKPVENSQSSSTVGVDDFFRKT